MAANVEPCYIDYGGPWPSSEREVKAIKSFIVDRKDSIVAFLTMHSFAQMVLSRWGYTDQRVPHDHNHTVCRSVLLQSSR